MGPNLPLLLSCSLLWSENFDERLWLLPTESAGLGSSNSTNLPIWPGTCELVITSNFIYVVAIGSGYETVVYFLASCSSYASLAAFSASACFWSYSSFCLISSALRLASAFSSSSHCCLARYMALASRTRLMHSSFTVELAPEARVAVVCSGCWGAF